VVSDVGHLMYIEKPEEFLTIVTHFLEVNRFEERPARVQ